MCICIVLRVQANQRLCLLSVCRHFQIRWIVTIFASFSFEWYDEEGQNKVVYSGKFEKLKTEEQNTCRGVLEAK